jgi:hypothetical protein
MRHYAIDSPEAIARILALTMLSDGGLDRKELEAFNRHQLLKTMGVDSHCLHHVMQTLCHDMEQFGGSHSSLPLNVSEAMLDDMFAEIQSLPIQVNILQIMLDIINADGLLCGGEARVISRAMLVWGLAIEKQHEARVPYWQPVAGPQR